MLTCCVALLLVLTMRQPANQDPAFATQFAGVSAVERIGPTSQIVKAPRVMLAASATGKTPYLLIP